MESRVKLGDGREMDLTRLSQEELRQLHWDEERFFARRIKEAERGSPERVAAIRDGYNTVSHILYRIKEVEGAEDVAFGYRGRNEDLILKVLARMKRDAPDRELRFFEIGFGLGSALALVAGAGHDVAGLEVAPALVEDARARLPERFRDRLIQGDFATVDLSAFQEQIDVVYWNDVFEHVPPDEMPHYLGRIAGMLRPGGVLVTVTPNWHVRPSDVTSHFRPPRSDPEGFHLKEYTIREIITLLRSAGFRRVEMPLFVTPERTILVGGGLATMKRALEPLLEFLPFRLCKVVTGGMGYHCTIAVR